MKTKVIFPAFCVAWVAFWVCLVLLVQQNDMKVQARNTELVQLVCDQMRSNLNKSSYAACGLAQNVTNTEYLCRSNSCWVEQK